MLKGVALDAGRRKNLIISYQYWANDDFLYDTLEADKSDSFNEITFVARRETGIKSTFHLNSGFVQRVYNEELTRRGDWNIKQLLDSYQTLCSTVITQYTRT